VFRDVTELICTQRALQESEERYRHFVQYANEGIWRFDVREPIDAQLPTEEQIRLIFERAYLAECNRAFARMYAVESPESLLGTPLPALLIPTDAQNRAMLKTFIENNYRIEGFVSHERAVDGSERYFLNSFFGVVEDGKLVRAWGVQTDITEMRRLQQELDRAYRLESIGRLAGGIAHDFNNVLTAVMGYAELARDRVRDEAILRYLDGIQKAAERAADLNKQLLAYARKQVIQPAPMNLGDWLGGTLDILRRVLPESVLTAPEIEPNLWQINADSNLLLQIVLNLVVNARDAMPNGGTITLRLRNRMLRRAHARTIPNGRYVLLEVEDTGTGIPPEVLPHIFEPFYTTKPLGQGTGMGLAAVQGAVQQLGGHIEVRTEVGKGTCFAILFPRLDPPKPALKTQ
jgi:two-component system cell cycle sensor histidine kinase/response regulator CckA